MFVFKVPRKAASAGAAGQRLHAVWPAGLSNPAQRAPVPESCSPRGLEFRPKGHCARGLGSPFVKWCVPPSGRQETACCLGWRYVADYLKTLV